MLWLDFRGLQDRGGEDGRAAGSALIISLCKAQRPDEALDVHKSMLEYTPPAQIAARRLGTPPLRAEPFPSPAAAHSSLHHQADLPDKGPAMLSMGPDGSGDIVSSTSVDTATSGSSGTSATAEGGRCAPSKHFAHQARLQSHSKLEANGQTASQGVVLDRTGKIDNAELHRRPLRRPDLSEVQQSSIPAAHVGLDEEAQLEEAEEVAEANPADDLQRIHRQQPEILHSYLVPQPAALAALVTAFACRGRLKEALKIFRQLQQDPEGLASTTLGTSRTMWQSLIEVACRRCRVDLALEVRSLTLELSGHAGAALVNNLCLADFV